MRVGPTIRSIPSNSHAKRPAAIHMGKHNLTSNSLPKHSKRGRPDEGTGGANHVPEKVHVVEPPRDSLLADLDNELQSSLHSLVHQSMPQPPAPSPPAQVPHSVPTYCTADTPSSRQSLETASVTSSVQLQYDLQDRLSFDTTNVRNRECSSRNSSPVTPKVLSQASNRAVLMIGHWTTSDSYREHAAVPASAAVAGAHAYLNYLLGLAPGPDGRVRKNVPTKALERTISRYIFTTTTAEARTVAEDFPAAYESSAKVSGRTSFGSLSCGRGSGGCEARPSDIRTSSLFSPSPVSSSPLRPPAVASLADGTYWGWHSEDQTNATDQIPSFPSSTTFLTQSMAAALGVSTVKSNVRPSSDNEPISAAVIDALIAQIASVVGSTSTHFEVDPLDILLQSNYLLSYCIAALDASSSKKLRHSVLRCKLATLEGARTVSREGAVAVRSAATKNLLKAQSLLHINSGVFGHTGSQPRVSVPAVGQSQFVTLPMNTASSGKQGQVGALLLQPPHQPKVELFVGQRSVCQQPPHSFTVLPPRHAPTVTTLPGFPPQFASMRNQPVFEFSNEAHPQSRGQQPFWAQLPSRSDPQL